MARRQLQGKSFFVYRSGGETPTPTWKAIACTESASISQSVNDLSAVTNCGVLHLPDSIDSSISFSMIPLIDQDTAEVALTTIQADLLAKDFHDYKITTLAADTGDPIFSFRGYVKEFNYDFDAGDFFKATGAIQVDDDGISLTTAP